MANERITLASHNDLNRAVEFDGVFQVHEDGTLTPHVSGVHAPSVYVNVDGDGQCVGEAYPDGSGWSFVNGFSGQDRYAGPVMHASEQLAGGMAKFVMSEPGFYCVTSVECLAEDEDTDTDDPAGWVLLKRDEEDDADADEDWRDDPRYDDEDRIPGDGDLFGMDA